VSPVINTDDGKGSNMKKKKAPARNPQKLTPYLLYRDVGKALAWFSKAFGFVESGDRFTGEDGTIQHAEMEISKNGEVFMLGCPGPKYKNPGKLGNVTALMYVTVDNVDQHFARAKKAGAKVLGKPEDTFYGDRRYSVLDPEGHQWYFAQHVRDVSAEEMKKAVAKK
jgi:PhnB protein